MTDASEPIAYVSDAPRWATPGADELRARIPGWGADLRREDRPSVPRLDRSLRAEGAHWDFPERQPGGEGRERSIEHAFLTPVFGTVAPLHGVSGAIRRIGYRYSEGRAAHWLLLIAGDRVDAMEARVSALLAGRPDNPVTETGILAERGKRPLSSRLRSSRADTHHTWIDPLIVAGPWIIGGIAVFRGLRRLTRSR